MRKKIIIGITKGTWGGAQKNVYDIVSALPKDEFDLLVIAGTSGRLTEKLYGDKVAVHTLKKLNRDVQIFSDIRSFFSLIRLLRKEKPRVVHFHSSKMGIMGTLAARIAGVPRIYFTVHGWAFDEKRSFFSRIVIFLLSWFTILFSHKVITLSQKDKERTERVFGFKEKILLIYNGFSCAPFPKKEDARQALHVPTDGTTHVGTVAELHKNKGLDYVLYAFAKLPSSFSFHIIGSGEEEKKLKALAQSLKIANRVYWHGFIENASAYLKAFDIFLLSSIKEGLPYVLLEAGCANLPVVATNVGSISEIIKNNETGILIKPADVQALVDALLFFASHEHERTLCGENLKQLIEKKFSTQSMIEKLLTIYRID